MKHSARLLFFVAVALLSACSKKPALLQAPAPTPVRNTGQIDVTCSMLSAGDTRKILSARLAREVTTWLCGIDNNSAVPVALGETKLIRSMAHLHPLGHTAMSLAVQESARNSAASRAGRVIDGAVKGLNVAAVTGALNVPVAVAVGGAFFIAYAPTAIQWLRGIDPPVASNFETIAPAGTAAIQPGGSAVMYIFSDLWGYTLEKQEFSIQVANLPTVKLAQ